jgi:hypothetical protein
MMSQSHILLATEYHPLRALHSYACTMNMLRELINCYIREAVRVGRDNDYVKIM